MDRGVMSKYGKNRKATCSRPSNFHGLSQQRARTKKKMPERIPGAAALEGRERALNTGFH